MEIQDPNSTEGDLVLTGLSVLFRLVVSLMVAAIRMLIEGMS